MRAGDHEAQRRHRNRGQWRVCEWCGSEYEGEPIGGCCSEGCLSDQREYNRHMEDVANDLADDLRR
jgi:hypothetical protein